MRDATVFSAHPSGVFDSAALKAIRRWRFEPMRKDGRVIEVIACQRIEFALEPLPAAELFFLFPPSLTIP